MKKTILVILTLIFSINLFGQTDFPIDVKTGKITYKEVIENKYDSVMNNEIIEKLLSDTVLFSDMVKTNENGKLIINAKGKIPVHFYYKENSTNKRSIGLVNYDISMLILKNKVGYKFTNFVHVNGKMAGGLLENKSGGWVATDYWEGIKKQTNEYIESLIKEIEISLKNKELGEEW